MHSKAERHLVIREIIGSATVASQDELRRLLKRRGTAVTQATLSRDMKEIGILWVNTPGGGHYALPPVDEQPLYPPVLENQIVAVQANECLVVVHTHPGSANIVAEFLDRLHAPAILGTVAGDNTVLVIPRAVRHTPEVVEFIKTTLRKGID